MWADQDVIEFVDEQVLAGQTILNIYHYVIDGTDVTESNIVSALKSLLVDKVCVIQSTSLEHVKMTLRNLTDGVSLYEETYSTPYTGLRSGEYLPSFAAWAFKLNRSSRATRNGQKRIAGVAEGDIQGDSPAAAFVAELNTAAGYIGGSMLIGSDTTLTPTIVRKDAFGGVAVANNVLNATFSRISTQNSRKVY